MTVFDYLNHNNVADFRIISMINWNCKILYDSTKTDRDLSNFLYDSIVENVYVTDSGITEIEI